jgi:transposase IS116/IS110/IS902 family protein
MHDSTRFPRVQDCVSYGRLVTGAKASAGKRDGPAGKKLGHAYLQWAFAAAAVLLLRHNAQGQPYRTRLEKKHAKGKALPIVAHTFARAVSSMVTRATVFEMALCLNGYGSSAGAPAAALDPHGLRLP